MKNIARIKLEKKSIFLVTQKKSINKVLIAEGEFKPTGTSISGHKTKAKKKYY